MTTRSYGWIYSLSTNEGGVFFFLHNHRRCGLCRWQIFLGSEVADSLPDKAIAWTVTTDPAKGWPCS